MWGADTSPIYINTFSLSCFILIYIVLVVLYMLSPFSPFSPFSPLFYKVSLKNQNYILSLQKRGENGEKGENGETLYIPILYILNAKHYLL
jgi:hypothetical protein